MSDLVPPASGVPPHGGPQSATSASGDVGERLHRPVRLVVAVLEIVAAGVAAWQALACWEAASGTMTIRLDDGTELVSRTLDGARIGWAFVLATVAGILLVDAGRQTMLGIRTRRWRRSRSRRELRRRDAEGNAATGHADQESAADGAASSAGAATPASGTRSHDSDTGVPPSGTGGPSSGPGDPPPDTDGPGSERW